MNDSPETRLSPEETSALVQRAITVGRRRVRRRQAASSVAAMAIVAGLGFGAVSVVNLGQRVTPPAASPPVTYQASTPAPSQSTPATPEPPRYQVDRPIKDKFVALVRQHFPDGLFPAETSYDDYVVGFTIGTGEATTDITVELAYEPGRIIGHRDGLTSVSPGIWAGQTESPSGPTYLWVRQDKPGATLTITSTRRSAQGTMPPASGETPLSDSRIYGIIASPDWDPVLTAITGR